jgi:hypothetical protein
MSRKLKLWQSSTFMSAVSLLPWEAMALSMNCKVIVHTNVILGIIPLGSGTAGQLSEIPKSVKDGSDHQHMNMRLIIPEPSIIISVSVLQGWALMQASQATIKEVPVIQIVSESSVKKYFRYQPANTTPRVNQIIARNALLITSPTMTVRLNTSIATRGCMMTLLILASSKITLHTSFVLPSLLLNARTSQDS